MRILLLLLLAGCASSKVTHMPDGSIGHSINCSGSALTWNGCYEKAGELCKERGYTVIAGGSDETAVVAGNQFGVYGSAAATRSMLVKCK